MPAVTQYIFDTSSDEYQQVEADFTKEITSRGRRFKRNWEFYDGIMPNPLKIGKDGVDDNILIPKVGQVSDKVVSFLVGDGVTFDASADGEETDTDKQIAALWDANRGEMLIHNIALTGAITGHLFARLEPRKEDLPRIVNLNPTNCAVFWDVADVDRVLWYRLQYQSGEYGSGKRVDYVRGRYAGGQFDHDVPDQWWEIVFATKGGFAPVWKQVSEPELWQYPWSPIVDWQNLPRPHAYYGMDDVGAVVRLNNALNFVESNSSRILKHHAYPKTVGLGFDAGEVTETEIGGFYTVNKTKQEADIFNLEMQSDLASSRAQADMLRSEMWQCARMVDPQSLKDKVGALTNFGLRVLYTDALHKTQTKRLLYGEGFEQINKHGLELMGKAVPDEIATVWPDVLPENELETVQSLQAELESGVIDKETYREHREYDHAQIVERLAEQGANEDNLGARMLRAFEMGQ